MPIEVQCTGCGHRLRVADNMAGKQGKCPKCKAILSMPASVEQPAETLEALEAEDFLPAEESKSSTSSLESNDVWYVRMPGGEQHGPLTWSLINELVAAGRINAHCTVLSPGAEKWILAPRIFPQLGRTTPKPGSPPAETLETNPYAAPQNISTNQEQASVDTQAFSRVSNLFATTRPWVVIVIIVGYCASILDVVLGAILALLTLSASSVERHSSQFFQLAVQAVISILVGCFGVYVCGLLHDYSRRIGDFVRRSTITNLEEALIAQQLFWRILGLGGIVFLALLVLLVLAIGVILVLSYLNIKR